MKHYRKLAVLITVAVLALSALCSCGKAKTYKFDSISVESTADSALDISDSMKSILEPLYKNSTLEIASDTATIIVDDQKNEMKMKNNGDKYILSGDYAKRVENLFGGADGGVKVEMYLLKSDNGYDYVIQETLNGMQITIKLHFVK